MVHGPFFIDQIAQEAPGALEISQWPVALARQVEW